MENQYGEKLKEARLGRNLTLEDVSDELKINLRTLRRMESSETIELPKAPFTRGFLKTYSLYLSLDSKKIIESYNATLGEPQTELKKGVLKDDDNKETVFALDFFKEQVFPFVLLIVTLAGALVIYSFLRQSSVEESAKLPKPLKTAVVKSLDTKDLTEVVDSSEGVKEKITAPGALATSKIQNLSESNKVEQVIKKNPVLKALTFENKLVVEPLAKTVLYIKTNNDKVVVEAKLKTDVKRTFRFNKAQIRFLDAGAVNIVLNGKDLGALGGFGEAKTIEFPSLKEL